MFEFIKKLFAKEVEKINVKTEELSNWFNEKTKDYSSELDNFVKEKTGHLGHLKKEVEEAVEGLMEAEIKDEEKIMPKVKNVVLAARNNYVRDLNHLINNLEIDISDKKNVVESCKMAQIKLDMFAQKTAKSYFTTQHLFHKPLEKLAGHLKELGKLVKELNDSVKGSKTSKAEAINGLISKLNKDIGLLKEWEKSVGDFGEKKKELTAKIEDIEKEIDGLKKTKEYAEYEDDIKKITSLKEKLKIRNNAIFELIAPLQAIIKKYERIAMDNEKLLKNYIDDVVKAFLQDNETILLDILQKMKDSIEKGSIELKDKKKEKALKQINTITKEKLEELKEDYMNAETKIKEVKERISNNDVQERQEELINKKNKVKDELDYNERDINEVKEMIEKIDLDKVKKDIVDKVKELLDLEVVLE